MAHLLDFHAGLLSGNGVALPVGVMRPWEDTGRCMGMLHERWFVELIKLRATTGEDFDQNGMFVY